MTNKYLTTLLILFAGVAFIGASKMTRLPSPPGAKVFFKNIKNGDVVSNPVKILFGVEGMKILPRGEQKRNSGHFHLLIDIEEIYLDEAIQVDEGFKHFSRGESEGTITFTRGKHTLQLLLGDFGHRPHDPAVISEKITITVK